MDILLATYHGTAAVLSQITWWQFALVLADYSLKIFALGWVPKDRRPTSAMAWLLAIFLIPFVGILLFFLMGSPYINGRRHRTQEAANELLRSRSKNEPVLPAGHSLSPELTSLARLNRELTALPATAGTFVGLHTDYQASIRAMAAAIDTAERFVNVQMYIAAWDSTTAPFFDALHRASQRGVKVRMLWDHVGSRKYPGNKRLGKRLDAMGVEHYMMLPLRPFQWRFRRPDLRNHRKIVVIDGTRAFMGSQNLIEAEYQQPKHHRIGRQWVDVMAEVTGPIVSSINTVFAVDWYTESKEELKFLSPGELSTWLAEHHEDTGQEIMQVIPSGPGFRTEPNLRLFTSIVHHAKERLKLVSPYFIPDESLLEAVTTACYRGVDVELFVSEQSDQFLVGHAQESYYDQLLAAGVKIYLYPAPFVLHSKFMIADGEIAVVGSSNMDMRSFGLNYEVTLMTGQGDLLQELRDTTGEYRERSRLLSKEEWDNRPWRQKYIANVTRLTSALL